MTEDKSDDVQGKALEGIFPFQLIDIYLYEVVARRGILQEPEGIVELPLNILLHPGNEPLDAPEFGLLVTFEFSAPSEDEPTCHILLALEGLFQAVVDVETIDPEIIRQFKTSDAIILFWPYLRQTLDDLVVRMRLPLPPLPVVDARSLVSPPPEVSEKSS